MNKLQCRSEAYRIAAQIINNDLEYDGLFEHLDRENVEEVRSELRNLAEKLKINIGVVSIEKGGAISITGAGMNFIASLQDGYHLNFSGVSFSPCFTEQDSLK